MELLIRSDNRGERIGSRVFITIAGYVSVEQDLGFSCLIIFCTSKQVTGEKKNELAGVRFIVRVEVVAKSSSVVMDSAMFLPMEVK